MKRFMLWSVETCCAFALILASFGANVSVQAQTDEKYLSQTTGLGEQSRFDSGFDPVDIPRKEIVPGTQMPVTSMMNDMNSSSSSDNSFGGILGRYDTKNFGKFFGTGTPPQRTPSTRIDSLKATGDNEVENVDTEKMYPPRLDLDFNKFPTRTLQSRESRDRVLSQMKNAGARLDIDPKVEAVRVSFDGTTVYLRGQVRSARCSRLLESVVGLQAGVERVVNELNVLEPETNNVDLFGNSNL